MQILARGFIIAQCALCNAHLNAHPSFLAVTKGIGWLMFAMEMGARNEFLSQKHRYVSVTLHLLEKVTRYVTVTAKLELVLERVTFRFVPSHYWLGEYCVQELSLNVIRFPW